MDREKVFLLGHCAFCSAHLSVYSHSWHFNLLFTPWHKRTEGNDKTATIMCKLFVPCSWSVIQCMFSRME